MKKIVLFVGLVVVISFTACNVPQPKESPEKAIRKELLKGKCYQVDINCYYFDANGKELAILLQTFSTDHPEMYVKSIVPSREKGAFVFFSSDRRDYE